MKTINKILSVGFAVAMIFGLAGPIAVSAAVTPSLGVADTFGVLAGTFTHNIANTAITGDVGYTTSSGGSTFSVIGGVDYGPGAPTPTARTDAATALTALSAGANAACDFSYGSPTDLSLLPQPLLAGVYCVTGAASIGTGGITLSGSGTFIFRIVGALTSVNNSNVTLANGASSCDVFWTPTAATTLGANTTFKGTIIDNANAITVGNLTAWVGRALSLGAGTITTDTNTITRTCSVAAVTPTTATPASRAVATINVVKVVVNDGGGTKKIADFPLFVNGSLVFSGVTNTFPAPAPAYAVTETGNVGYTQTFSGDCDANGNVGLTPGDNKFCIITNNDIAAPIVPIVPPLIDVVKVASPLALPNGPGSVVYTYTLRNIGTVPVTDVTMVGDTCSPIKLISGDMNADGKLDVNETWVHTCSTSLAATHTNTVVTTGWANGISAVDIASATVVVGVPIVPPLIHVTKVPSPLALSALGGMVTYTNHVTNPGLVALSNVHLSDDKCAIVQYVYGDTNNDQKLDPTETWIYICTQNLTKTTINTVSASGDANGLTARDFAIVTVVVAFPGLPNTGFPPASTFGQQVRAIVMSLKQGDHGDHVSTLQQFLIAQGKGSRAAALAGVGATAHFGPLTRAALAEFQASVGIAPALGNFGPVTRAYLKAHQDQ